MTGPAQTVRDYSDEALKGIYRTLKAQGARFGSWEFNRLILIEQEMKRRKLKP